MEPRDTRSHRRPQGWTTLPATARFWPPGRPPPEAVMRAGEDAVTEFHALAASPPASQWDPAADLSVVVRVVLLRAAIAAGDETGVKRMGELRALEDRLGLSALARERLRWRLPTDRTTTETDDADVVSLADYMEDAR